MKRGGAMRPRISDVVVLPSASNAAPIVTGSSFERHSTDEAISDGVISAKVLMRLVGDPVTAAYEIHVETFKGTVQLQGFVETTEVRIKALLLARDVEGVQQVDDSLDVRSA
jgi:osmotically-inducible protein OsmY